MAWIVPARKPLCLLVVASVLVTAAARAQEVDERVRVTDPASLESPADGRAPAEVAPSKAEAPADGIPPDGSPDDGSDVATDEEAVAADGGDEEAEKAADEEPVDPEAVSEAALVELALHIQVQIDVLGGADEAAGLVEAARLLQTLESTSAVARARAERVVILLLDPDRVDRARDASAPAARAARRLVESLALHPGDESAILDVVEMALIPLLGRGSVELRQRVVHALTAAVERPAAEFVERTAKIAALLGDEIEHNAPPDAPRLEDLSAVLWELDAKQFLGRAITGLAFNESSHPEVVPSYVRELRSRILLDLDSSAEWSDWWKRHRNDSISRILVETQRGLSLAGAERWTHSLRRLRETGAARPVLDEITEAFSKGSTREIREAAVRALGDYADWVRTAPLGAVESPDVQRALLSAEACELLLTVIQGQPDRVGYRSVERLAFAALLKFQPFLERAPSELLDRVHTLCVERLEAQLSSIASPQTRAGIVEIAYLAGGLRIAAARPALETLALTPEASRDAEVLLAVVPALGRLVKGGLEASTAEIFLGLFESADQLGESAAGKLRIRAIAALNARPASLSVAARVREFYERILGSASYRDLRIHAVIGLGTLAQAQDRAAFESLVRALTAGKLDGSEEIAALDAIAYVGGRPAIESLVPLFTPLTTGLSEQRRAVGEHLRRKIVGLLHGASAAEIALLLARLETLAVNSGDVSAIAFVREISDSADVARLRWGAAASEASPGPSTVERARLSLDALRAALVVAPESTAALVKGLRVAFDAAAVASTDVTRVELELLAAVDERARDLATRLDSRDLDSATMVATLETLLASGLAIPPRAAEPNAEASAGFGAFAVFAIVERELARRRGNGEGAGRRQELIDRWKTLLSDPRRVAVLPAESLRAHLSRLEELRRAPAESGKQPSSSPDGAPSPGGVSSPDRVPSPGGAGSQRTARS